MFKTLPLPNTIKELLLKYLPKRLYIYTVKVWLCMFNYIDTAKLVKKKKTPQK